MVTGVAGKNGLAAPRHVDLAIEAGQETVTTQLQLMEAETVRDQAQSLTLVIQIYSYPMSNGKSQTLFTWTRICVTRTRICVTSSSLRAGSLTVSASISWSWVVTVS